MPDLISHADSVASLIYASLNSKPMGVDYGGCIEGGGGNFHMQIL